jgi:hypothetical protein
MDGYTLFSLSRSQLKFTFVTRLVMLSSNYVGLCSFHNIPVPCQDRKAKWPGGDFARFEKCRERGERVGLSRTRRAAQLRESQRHVIDF